MGAAIMAYEFEEEPDFLRQLVPDKPQYVFEDEKPIAASSETVVEKPSFLGGMKANAENAIRSAGDILSGNFQTINGTVPTPKTEALGEKLFPAGSDGSFMGALRNVGNTNLSDYSGALLEKFGESGPGKALSVIGGLNPVYNAAGTAISQYVNPAIEKATGIHPDNLALLELAGSTTGLRQARNISDPTVNLIKSFISGKENSVSAADLAASANRAYAEASQKGGELNPSFTNKFLSEIESAKPKPIAGKVLTAEDRKFIGSIDDFKKLRDSKLTLEDAQRIDEALGNKIDGLLDNGRVTKDARKIIGIQDKFRSMIESADGADIAGGKEGFSALKQGRELWARSARMRDVEKIITRAELMDNPATGIKTGFRTLLANDKRLRGFTKEERSLIKKAAQSGAASDALRAIGSRLVPMGAALANGPAAGAAAHILSTASRAGATKLQLSRAQKLADVIARGPKQNNALAQIAGNSVKALPSGAADAFLAALSQQREPLINQ